MVMIEAVITEMKRVTYANGNEQTPLKLIVLKINLVSYAETLGNNGYLNLNLKETISFLNMIRWNKTK